MNSSERPILVTGATGRVGGIGRHVAAELVRQGLPVRALVRRLDERSEALQAMGVNLVVADFADYGSLLRALEDVESAYFSYPVDAGLTVAAGLFAAAGLERGLRTVVDLSLDAAFPESPSPQGRAEWVAERMFEWAGYGGTHLRVAAFFMENLLTLYGSQIREHGEIRNSFGDVEPSWIAGSDVGAMVAALLAKPTLIAERTTVVGAGQRASHTSIAGIITEATGQPVHYQILTPEEWREELITNAAAVGRSDPTVADHLSAQSVALRRHNTHRVTDDVVRLTGHRPVSLGQFVARNRQAFMRQSPPGV
jgi:uncharacterized protein YbjT (DUF2867 family)